MRVGMMEQVSAARFNEIARHFNVVMGEIQQEHFETVQGVGTRVKSEFAQFANETHDFHFGFNIDLILINIRVI